MYCNIQKKPLSEIVERWSVLIDFADKKIYQFYILANTLSSFNTSYSLISKSLNLVDSGDLALQAQSTSLSSQIQGKLPLANLNYSFTVKNFGDSWSAKPDDWYSRGRFGHDYDQELMESKSLKHALKEFDGKIVVFTWIDTNKPKLIQTAITSHFKDGVIEPILSLVNQEG